VEAVSAAGTLLVATGNGPTAVHADGSYFVMHPDLRDLSDFEVVWLSDIGFWNKYYWLCGPMESWRFKPEGDVYDFCTFSESNLVGIPVVLTPPLR
jgi:hypothetical protein